MAHDLSSSCPTPPLTPHFTGKSARALVTEDANSVHGALLHPVHGALLHPGAIASAPALQPGSLLLHSPPPLQVSSQEQADEHFPWGGEVWSPGRQR